MSSVTPFIHWSVSTFFGSFTFRRAPGSCLSRGGFQAVILAANLLSFSLLKCKMPPFTISSCLQSDMRKWGEGQVKEMCLWFYIELLEKLKTFHCVHFCKLYSKKQKRKKKPERVLHCRELVQLSFQPTVFYRRRRSSLLSA